GRHGAPPRGRHDGPMATARRHVVPAPSVRPGRPAPARRAAPAAPSLPAPASLLVLAPQRERGRVELAGHGGVDRLEEVELDVLPDAVGDEGRAGLGVDRLRRLVRGADDLGDPLLVVEEHDGAARGDGAVDDGDAAPGVEPVLLGEDADLVGGDRHQLAGLVGARDLYLTAFAREHAQVGLLLVHEPVGDRRLAAVLEPHVARRGGAVGVYVERHLRRADAYGLLALLGGLDHDLDPAFHHAQARRFAVDELRPRGDQPAAVHLDPVAEGSGALAAAGDRGALRGRKLGVAAEDGQRRDGGADAARVGVLVDDRAGAEVPALGAAAAVDSDDALVGRALLLPAGLRPRRLRGRLCRRLGRWLRGGVLRQRERRGAER